MKTKTNVAPLFATIITIGSLSGGAMAQTYGITGSFGSGNLDSHSIYRVHADGSNQKIGSTGSVVGNSLAYNNVADVYYYGDHTSTNLYAFNPNTSSSVLVADLTAHGMQAGDLLSGGADFYNNTYYYSPEAPEVTANGTPSQASKLYSVTFSANGQSIVSHSDITPSLPSGWASLGDFGDFAIDQSTGVLYGASSGIDGTSNAGSFFWSIDLNQASLSVTNIAQTSTTNLNAYQLAFDATTGELYGNAWQSSSYYEIDKATGNQIGTVSIGGDFYDLASGIVPVPEPSSTFLLGLGGISLLLRRNR